MLKTIAPSRDALVIAVKWVFTWYGLADLGARDTIPFGLGHALSMKAMHGSKATNDTIAAQKIAGLLRGGLLPQTYVYPAERRATRDLLRRRMSLTRKRAALRAPIPNTHSPYNLPEIGTKRASKANCTGVAERLPDPAVQQSVDVDLALIGSSGQRLNAVELHSLTAAKQHDAQTLYGLQTGPGIGTILRLGLFYELHAIQRFPRVQDVVSSGRLVKCAKASAGKRSGFSGATIGNASRKGTFSEAAGLCLRDHPAGQQSLTRVEKPHGQGQA